MSSFQIALLPGDGIGPEVVTEAVKVLRAVENRLEGVQFQLQEFPVGANEYLRSGDPLPPGTMDRLREYDAILLGAMGLPHVRWPTGTEMTPQLDLREQLELRKPRRVALVVRGDEAHPLHVRQIEGAVAPGSFDGKTPMLLL